MYRELISRLKPTISGKSKEVIPLSKKTALIKFKDDISAFNGKKHAIIPGKGRINAEISAILFEKLRQNGIINHYKFIDSFHQIVCEHLDIIPLEVVVRLKAWGSIIDRLSIKKDIQFDTPIVELYYKRDDLGDPFINSDHARYLGIANRHELAQMYHLAIKSSLSLQKIFAEAEIDLVDIKLEFGRLKDIIMLSDELSPDNMRLHDMRSEKILDKDVFRKDLGNVFQAYQTVLNRLTGAKSLPNHDYLGRAADCASKHDWVI